MTVEDQKSVEIPEGNEVTATVTVEQRQKGFSLNYEPAADQDVTVEAVTRTRVLTRTKTTDANGEVTVTFTGENAGETNVTALTTNGDGTEYNTTGSEQATVDVFGTAANHW
ncbi:MAG: hypothetical protein U5K28_11925 [Halobacteriales archaeon]|nr:hypothetical protein [Halobacteriales archaeon]